LFLPEANNALARCSASILVLIWDEIVHEPPLSQPIVHPPRGELPVLLSVPHSGRDYPDWLVAIACAGKPSLVALEDPLVDRLIWRARQRGCGAVIATAPRAAVDCNRAEDELDPSVIDGARRGRVTARARGGLGIVPARTQQHGYLWRRAISLAQLEERIEQGHRPYHRSIERQLSVLLERFGCALLLDCHSMPPPPGGVPPVVFGDCRGRTADGWISREAVAIAKRSGFEARLNDPFAGGHVIERHARPARGVHALQIELDRRSYLDDGLKHAGPGFDKASSLIEALAVGLGEALLGSQFATAAE
jgi:N-formylglutamate amidohydrolase